MSEWCVEHHQAHPAPPAQEHVLAAVGVLGPAPPLQMHMELLAGIPAQALLDALAQKSKAELGQFSQDLCKVSEKLGKRLVPIRDEKISPDRCVRCHTIHARCDGKRPCGRCLSRNLEAQCVFHTDPDYVPRQRRSRQRRKRPFEEDLSDSVGESVPPPPSSPPSDGLEQAAPRRQKRDGKANVRPARREGVTASGDILCPHGIEKRYCLDQGCLANGGGKAMCQHGRRRRVCKEPECKAETERKRQEMEARRCIHGRQKRLCREGDCIKEFSEASKAYREMVHQRRSEVLQHSIKHPAVRAVRKLCEHPDCGELAIFGPKPDGRRVDRFYDQKLFCRVHKEEDHVDLSKAICTVDGCTRVARFGEIGARPLTCVDHSQPQFVDCKTKRCEHVEPSEDGNSAGTLCLAGANYGDPLERKRRFCRAHKRPNDVQLAQRRRIGDQARHEHADPSGEAPMESSEDNCDGEIEVEDAGGEGVGGSGVGLGPGGGCGSQGLARNGYFPGLVHEASMDHHNMYAIHQLPHKGHGMQVDSSVAAPIPDCAVHVHGQVVDGPGVVHVDAVAAPIGEGGGSVVVEGGEVVVDTVTHQPAPESVEEDMPVQPHPPEMSAVHEVK